MIQLSHVYKTYDADRHALKDVSIHLKPSDFAFLSGPSGAGKTTLFKIFSAQEKPTEGRYLFNNKDVLQFSNRELISLRRVIGVVFQDFKLISDMSVFDNIELPLSIQGKPKKESINNVLEIADSLNLTDILKSYPDYLSGGEKQRVAVARALVHQPQFIIADEPTGNLDKKNSDIVLTLLKNFSVKNNIPVLIATHDENLIHRYGNRWIQLDNGNLIKDDFI